MELVTTPVALPGCCFICRAATRESYIDTGVSLDFDGAFYICNICCEEIAKSYGYISHDEYKDLRGSKEELERLNYELIKRVGGLEESVRGLANAGYRLHDDGNVVISGGYLPQTVEPVTEKPPVGENDVGAGEGEASEQSDDEGVGELHSDESSSGNEFELEF